MYNRIAESQNRRTAEPQEPRLTRSRAADPPRPHIHNLPADGPGFGANRNNRTLRRWCALALVAAVILAIPTAPAEAQQTSGPALTNVLATPATVTLGEHTMLSWDYRDDVVYVIIRGPDQAANVYTRFSNKWSTTPAQTGDITYTLEAYNAGVKLDAVTVTVTVTSAPSGPVLSNVVANPATVMEGGSSTLSWTPRADVEAVLISGGGLLETQETGTSHVVTPTETTTYTLVAMGEGAELGTFELTVTVTSAPSGPALTNVLANPATIKLGESSALQWTPREDVEAVLISGGGLLETQETGTSHVVTPTETTTYTLVAMGEGAELGTFELTVTVNPTWVDGPALTNVLANPATIKLGESSALQWTPREDVEAVLISGGGLLETQETGTSHVVTPTETTTYTLVAMGEGAELGTFELTVTVTSAPSGPALTNVLANPATVMEGGSSTLSWTPREDVEAVLISGGGLLETQETGTSHVVTPTETTTYTLVAMGEGAELGTFELTVTVTSAPSGPALTNVLANPATVMEGGSSTLSWTPREDVEAVLISGGGLLETQETGTSHVVTPTETTTYTLVAMGEGAELGTFELTVTVTSAPSGPALTNVLANPATVMEGGSSTLSWTPREDVEAVLISGGGLLETQETGTSHVVTPTETTTYTLVAMGEGAELGTFELTVTVTSAPSGPALTNVLANPATIKLGESSALQWTPREDVVNVRVLLGDQVLEARVDPLEGRYVVTPDALGTVTYTLVPENEEGAPLPTYDLTVTVNPTWVDEAALTNVLANPATIKLGESSALQWTPREDVVNVRVLLGDQVLEARVDPLEGRYVVTPDALGTVTYTLVPENEEGAPLPTYDLTVTVNPTWVDEAVLTNVLANPATIKLGESSALQWTPREDVVNVRVLLGDQVLEARVDPLEGRYVVTPDALGTVTYTLVPENEEGAPLPTYDLTVTVNPTWVDEAALTNVLANPATIKLGESSALQWTPREDVVNVRVLLGDQVLEARVDPLEGRYVVTPDALGTVTYTLVPENEEGAPLPTYDLTVTVNPTWVDEAVLTNVLANPATIKLGESSALQWTPREDVVNVRVLLGDQVLEARVDPLEGRYVVTPDALGTVTYTLVPENEEGAPLPTYDLTVTVTKVTVPLSISSFTINGGASESIQAGEAVTLRWTLTGDAAQNAIIRLNYDGKSEVVADGNELHDTTMEYTIRPQQRGQVVLAVTNPDAPGDEATASVAVSIKAAPEPPEPNAPPVAKDDQGPTVDYGQSVTIETETLLENDTDLDGDTLTVTAVSGAQQGTVSLSGVTITFTHDGTSDASQGYAFTYTVSDGNGGTDTATVSGTVAKAPEPNAPPVAKDDQGPTVDYGQSVTIETETLLENDTDLDGDTLTVTAVSGAQQGTVSLSGVTITFTHDGTSDASQGYAFTYTVSDGNGGTDTATVSGRVTPVLSRPHVAQVDVTSSPGGDATYTEGEVIEVTVTFSEPVTVSGSPQLELTVGAARRAMRFVRAAGAKLVFAYTVVWNDRDDDGVSVAANVLRDGAIRSAAGVDADLSHDALPNQPGHKVLGLAAPTVGDLLPDLTLVAGGDAQVVDLTPAFIGASAYAAVSSTLAVATVSVADAALTVTPSARQGTATVTVTASNRAGSVDQTFTVRVMLDPAEAAVIEATLAAFGRNVLASATDTIGRRFESTSRSSTLTVAGRRIPLAESEGAEAAGSRIGIDPAAEQFVLASSWLGQPGGWSPTVGGVTASEAALRARSGMGGARDLTTMDLLERSEFALVLGGAASPEAASGADDRRLWTVWGAGDLRSFNGDPAEGVSYSGRPTLAYVGLDTERGRLLAGVAVSHAMADMSYSFQNLGSGKGEMSAGLTSIQPYLRYAVDARTDVWGIFGAGSGSLDLTRSHAEGKETSDLGLLMGSAGVRRELGSVGAADLALRGDVGMVRLSTDGASGVMLADRLANVQRYRVGVEVSTTQAVGGGQVKPFVELGGLYDGGSGQTGAGMEVAGGLQFLHPGSGFGLEARARMLALHAASGYSEHGVMLMASLTPGGRDGRGLSLSVTPGYGAPAQGSGMMWRDQVFGGAPAGLLSNNSAILDSRVAYGLQLGQSASSLLTPYSEYGFAEAQRRLRFGVRLGAPDNVPRGLQFDFAGEQFDYNGRRDYQLGVLARIRF